MNSLWYAPTMSIAAIHNQESMCFGSVWANLLSFKLRKNFLKYSYELIMIAQAGATFAILGNRPVENKTRIKYHPNAHFKRERERNVLFKDALNTFYLRLYFVRHMVKDHSKTHFKREREKCFI